MAIPFLNNINLSDNQLLNAKVHITSTAPTAAKGQIYLDSTASDNKLKYYDGTGWVIANSTVSASFATGTGVITFTQSSGDTFTVDIDGRFVEDFIIAGDSGSDQTITNGNTITISGGTELESVGSATDTITINHSDVTRTNTTGTALTPANGGNFDVITGVTSNARGHVTGVETTNVTIPDAYDFIVAGDSGTDQTISDGNTLTIAGGTELSSVGSNTDTITISHDDVSRSDSTATALTPDFGGNVDVITGVTSNARGHITAVETTNITIPQNDSVDVTEITTDAAYYPAFVSGTGDVAVNIDGSAADKLSYNPSSQTLTVKNLVVDGTQTILDETVQVVENSTILFEGTTADDFETKLTVVDPTADRTISLPDDSGTVVLKAFKTVSGDTNSAVADSATDTLTIAGGSGITTEATASSDTITINHDDTSSQASVNNSGNTVIQDVTLDTYGHITGLVSATIVVPTDREFVVDLDATDSNVAKTTNTYTVTHSLNSRDVIVEVYHTTNYDTIFVDIARATADTITVEFAAAVTDGDYRVLIKKIG